VGNEVLIPVTVEDVTQDISNKPPPMPSSLFKPSMSEMPESHHTASVVTEKKKGINQGSKYRKPPKKAPSSSSVSVAYEDYMNSRKNQSSAEADNN
jgi:hypothetical protein